MTHTKQTIKEEIGKLVKWGDNPWRHNGEEVGKRFALTLIESVREDVEEGLIEDLAPDQLGTERFGMKIGRNAVNKELRQKFQEIIEEI